MNDFKIEHLVQYKNGVALCGKYFKADECEKARKFAARHDTYHCAVLMYEVDESIPAPRRNQWLISETPLPFKKNGKWVQVFAYE